MDPIEIKILPCEYEPISAGVRSFVVTFKKLGIGVGDVIKLREYVCGKYTGRDICKEVKYVYNSDGAYGLLNIYAIICFDDSVIDYQTTIDGVRVKHIYRKE